ncbi:MAG TPA: TerC family protein [Anaeromyxobacter sp.]|nr:TerC family protein [Anaeromyxobacter sp.]
MTTTATPLLWASFVALAVLCLVLDLGVLNRRDHTIPAAEALRWSALWGGLALLFCAFVAWRSGGATALDFLTGYVLELSLSVDNLFVFVLVFASFSVPPQLHHRVLFWGILGAIVLRGAMILAGVALLTRFEWLLYLFGAFLVISGMRFLFHRPEQEHPERSWAFRSLRRVIPSTPRVEGHRFTLVEDGRRLATPLLLSLILIELADVVFALDSVPAIFGVTLDPFVVFSSNIFAILGLRSLFSVLSGLLRRFEHLHTGLSVVLILIGAKMILARWVHVPSAASLGAVLLILGTSIAYSVWQTGRAS